MEENYYGNEKYNPWLPMLFDMLFQAAFLICALQNHNFTTSNTIRMKTISSSKMWGFFTTHCIFLGLKFLVRNKEKDEIPCQGMRKIQGIFLPTFLCNLSKRWIKKGAQNFPKKSPYSWNTIFNPSYNFYCIFMH